MQIQLTKTKTITIGGGPKKRKSADIVGVDLFAGDERGCPAVRLTEKKGALRVTALGFVPPPSAPLPDSWEAAAKSCTWSLPSSFQAPRAALAVTSAEMFLAQTTAEAFRSDLMAGGHKTEEPASAGKRKFALRRESKPTTEAVPAPNGAPVALPTVQPGEPVSHGGTRFVMKPVEGTQGFVMEAGLPEYQLLWLSRLLPEGRRPTAASIQLRPAAVCASILRQPAFVAADGTALALFFTDTSVQIAGYKNSDLVLWRPCHGIPGWQAIRKAVRDGLGLDETMVESVLNDTLIDPRPVLEPLLAPLLGELSVSRDYLIGKLGVEPKAVFTAGMPAGFRYLHALAEERTHLQLSEPSAFEGLTVSDRAVCGEGATAEGPASHAFLGALGAALALTEEERAK